MKAQGIVRRSVCLGLATCLAVLASSASMAAQNAIGDPSHKFYAGATFELSYQPDGPRIISAPDQPNSRVGGSAWGGAATFGCRLARIAGLSGEISVPSRFMSLQDIAYFDFSRAEQRHRDMTVSGLVHLYPRSEGAIQPAFVIGISYVQEDTLSRTSRAPLFGPQAGVFGPYGSVRSIQRNTVGLIVGADLAVALNDRLDVVPQVRVHWIDRDEFDFLYLSQVVVRGGVGLRVKF
jgi:hypothetical protein